MIFTYWEGESSAISGFVAEWSRADHDVRVYTRRDVAKLIERKNAFECSQFERLRIPEARASIARFVLLQEHGGFYIAPGTSPGDPAAIRVLHSYLETYAYVTFIKEYSGHGMPVVLDFAVLARKEFNLPDLILNSIFTRLSEHDRLEASSAKPVSYRLEKIAGSENAAVRLFSTTPEGFKLNSYLTRPIKIESVSAAIGHQAFSTFGAMAPQTSMGTTGGSSGSEPLLAHPRWETAKVRRIFGRVASPTRPQALALWHEAWERIVLTGPVQEEDVEWLNKITHAADAIYDDITKLRNRNGHEIAMEVAYWFDVYENCIDGYLIILVERALREFEFGNHLYYGSNHPSVSS